uniref:Uncharacterized protein n=1 Tax=Anguilla anguilla TaxID=7936 RepID=A0A0E9WYD5_ANGAN
MMFMLLYVAIVCHLCPLHKGNVQLFQYNYTKLYLFKHLIILGNFLM